MSHFVVSQTVDTSADVSVFIIKIPIDITNVDVIVSLLISID